MSLCYNILSINIMERQLQDIFQQILSEYMVPVSTRVPAQAQVPAQVPAPTTVPVPAPAQVPVPTPAPRTSSRTESYDTDHSIQNLHIIDAVAGMMDDYKQIMNGYNDNIYTMLNIIRDGIVPVNSQSRPRRRSNSNRTTTNTTNTTSRPIYTNTLPRQTTSNAQPIFTYLFYPERTRQNFDNVVVRPTQQQIDDVTERITYSIEETNVNTSCPITLEEFQEGDLLCKIKPCSHLFRERSIQEWFLSNVRCPVCRYDIRDYLVDASLNVPSSTSSRTNNNNNNNAVNDTIDSILDNFSQQFSTAIFNNFIDLSGNTTLDITLEEELYVD